MDRWGSPQRLFLMNGLYALKPWYAARLDAVRGTLAARQVTPDALTWLGVGLGAGAGAALAFGAPGVVTGALVGALLAGRLACANLDGSLARSTGRTSRRGAVVNELGDRLAELAALAGCLFIAPVELVALAAFASVLPSWVSLAGAAAGARRVQGGPLGKTERAVVLVVIGLTGWTGLMLAVWVLGCLVTAVLRLTTTMRILGKA